MMSSASTRGKKEKWCLGGGGGGVLGMRSRIDASLPHRHLERYIAPTIFLERYIAPIVNKKFDIP